MFEVERRASLHEDTVKDAAKHVGAYSSKRRGRGPAKSSSVTRIVVNDQVWRTALALADGDRHRLQVVTDSEVRVLNARS